MVIYNMYNMYTYYSYMENDYKYLCAYTNSYIQSIQLFYHGQEIRYLYYKIYIFKFIDFYLIIIKS